MHDAVLDVERDAARVAELADKCMQRVAVADPADDARVGRERDDSVARDRERAARRLAIAREQRVDEAKELRTCKRRCYSQR